MINENLLYNFAKLIVLGLVVNVFMVGYVFWMGYEGRRDLVTSQRAGCNRAKLDRGANAEGWRIAEGARRADGEIEVANNYRDIASGLEKRSRIICSEAFPKASFIP